MNSGKPNILVFFTDQQRWDTMGLNGNPMGLTPNLDRLAREGTFFKHAVTPQPVCGPARSCLQTGQYATSTGVWKNGPGLKEDAVTLAQCFNEAGYRTAYFGKWHLSEGTGVHAVPKQNRGGYSDWLGANCVELVSGPYSSVLYNEENEAVQLPGYRVDAQTDAMIRYLKTRADKKEEPFLLFHSFLEPHHQNTDDSYPAPDGYREAYEGRWIPPDLRALGGSTAGHWAGYCGMVKRLDEALGRTLEALESLGLRENTVIAFISDHGCHFKTRNAEYKRTGHESSIRVPMVFSGPGWQGGGEKTGAASLVDLMPSLLDTADISIPETVQGKSLFPTNMEGQNSDEPTFIQIGDSFVPTARALRTNRWKYIVKIPEGAPIESSPTLYEEVELYDLRTDPYELQNLVNIGPHTAVCDEMRIQLSEYIRKVEGTEATIKPAEKITGHTQRTVDYPRVY